MFTRKPPGTIPPQLDVALEKIKQSLGDPPDLIIRTLPLPRGRSHVAIAYIKQFADTVQFLDGISDSLANPNITRLRNPAQVAQRLAAALSGGNIHEVRSVPQAVTDLLSGALLVLAHGSSQAQAVSLAPATYRTVTRPEAESTIRGPQEGFVEQIDTNLAIVRKRLRTPGLRVEQFTLGRRSQCKTYLIHIDGIANPDIVEEARIRLRRIDVDSVSDAGKLVELIEDSPFALLPQMKPTERPDIVTANLLEGRFAILVDGSPYGLIAPITFWQFFQAVDDYAGRFLIGSWLRLLRITAAIISIIGPASYVAVVTFHQELLPPQLAITLAASREPVPFPAAAEAITMKLVLDLLLEAGLRLPRVVGPAVSIVGALILGDAAVSAGLASPALIVVIAGTAISSFAIPDINIFEMIRALTYVLLILASIAGFFGMLWGLLMIITSLITQRSFGIPLLYPMAPGSITELRDVFIRFPHWALTQRPALIARDKQRIRPGLRPRPPRGRTGS